MTKKLSSTQFFISQIFILIFGLIIIGGIYYILNIQYKSENKPFSNGPLTSAPKSLLLNLDHPEDNLLSFDGSILVSGKTAGNMEVLIFTDSENQVIKSKSDGSFSTEINLVEGENLIRVTVFDDRGDSRSSERTVFYSEEKL